MSGILPDFEVPGLMSLLIQMDKIASHQKFIVLTSSGSNINGQSAKQIDKLSTDISSNQMTKSPLAGINIDIEHLKQIAQYFKKSLTIIESSKYKNCLLSRQTIMQNLFKQFSSNQRFFVNFYFTGHGYLKGAMCIQTKENPDGQPLYLEQIYDLFKKACEKYKFTKMLNIYLDCCYAGKMAALLKNKRDPIYKINVYCSSGPSHKSFDVNNYGGLLICGVWSKYLKDCLLKKEKEQLGQKFRSRLPIKLTSLYINQKLQWSQLQEIGYEYLN